MIGAIKRTLRQAFPETFAKRDEASTRQALDRLTQLTREFVQKHGAVVQSGPFSGMLLPQDTLTALSMPKLLGCYEAELYPVILGLPDYRTILNIGCAEGYYAIGMARRFPQTTVYAFDILENERRTCGQAAVQNQVGERVRIEAECSQDQLRELCGSGTLILIDCEGCEYPLLQPEAVPSLAQTDILAELHDLGPGSQPEDLLKRFQNTHEIERIYYPSVERSSPLVAGLAPDDQRISLKEFRDKGLEWAFLKARKSAQPS